MTFAEVIKRLSQALDEIDDQLEVSQENKIDANRRAVTQNRVKIAKVVRISPKRVRR